jgi:hypothetical protein
MQSINGKGYDSRDPKVVRQHVQWIEALGVNALLVDLTNWLNCDFNGEGCDPNRPDLRTHMNAIRGNVVFLYGELDRIRLESGTKLKIIPLIGAQPDSGLSRESAQKSGTELCSYHRMALGSIFKS